MREKGKSCRGSHTSGIVENSKVLKTGNFILTPLLICRNAIPISSNMLSKLSKTTVPYMIIDCCLRSYVGRSSF